MNYGATFGSREEGTVYRDREGAYLVAVEQGMLAAVETPEGLFLPGGGLENGEGLTECVRRECLEELGRNADGLEYLGCADEYMLHAAIGWLHPIQHYYAGKLGEQVCRPIEVDHSLRLVPVEEAVNSLFLRCQRWAVERLLLRQKENAQKNVDF